MGQVWTKTRRSMSTLLVCLILAVGTLSQCAAQQIETRIVGGEQADVGKYEAFILWGGCGATLIHNDIALTSAHCSGGSVAQIGTTRRDGSGDGSIKSQVIDRIEHPDFNSSTFEYDFAVFKLGAWVNKETVRFSSGSPNDGDNLTVIGFGLTSERGTNSDVLLEGQVAYVNPDTCASIFSSVNPVPENIMLCAMGSGVDACVGDSGGPIFNSAGEQFGVTSWGVGCAREGVPGVYARVEGAVDWIESQLCLLSENPPSRCLGDGGDDGGDLKSMIRVDIYYDENPWDISWSITSVDGDEIATSDLTIQEDVLVSTFVSISNGDYEFAIEDSFGDGFDGKYELFHVGKGEIVLSIEGNGIGIEARIDSFRIGDVAATDSPTIKSAPSLNNTSTSSLTSLPTSDRTSNPSASSTRNSTKAPTAPTFVPTRLPATIQEEDISLFPSDTPSDAPTISHAPTAIPSAGPTKRPTFPPNTVPTLKPSTSTRTLSPTTVPTVEPSTSIPTLKPLTSTLHPTTTVPTLTPSTSLPTLDPYTSALSSTTIPTLKPSTRTLSPTNRPTLKPPTSTLSPTNRPTLRPSTSTLPPTTMPTRGNLIARVDVIITETPEKVAWRIMSSDGTRETSFLEGFYKETGPELYFVILSPGTHIVEFSNSSGEGGVTINISPLVGAPNESAGSGDLEGEPTLESSSFQIVV